MLDAQLPIGTPRTNVSLYLDTQGCILEPSQKPKTLVVIIRKIDMQRMEPITARVTFHFDANDRIASTEIQRAPNAPAQ